MFNFLKKLWVLLTGMFIRKGNNLVASSPEAIRSTYAAAISEAKVRYKDMQQALALMMNQQRRLEKSLLDLENQHLVFDQKLQGAVRMAQTEPENTLHKQAGAKYLSTLEDIDKRKARIEAELNGYEETLTAYNNQLMNARTEVDRLKEEEVAMISEFVSSQQRVQLEERLAGLSTTSAVDESLVAIREQVERMKSEADIASKIRVTGETDVYAEIGAEQTAAARFEELVKAKQQTKAAVNQTERSLG